MAKRIKYAWIEQVICFDSPEEMADYLRFLDYSGIRYSIVQQSGAMLRIRKQYNKNEFLERG